MARARARGVDPPAHQDDSSSSCGACIRAHLTFTHHKFMQNNSTTTVHYGVDGAGSKTLPEPRVLRSSSARVRAPRSCCFLARAAALVFWPAISIRLTSASWPCATHRVMIELKCTKGASRSAISTWMKNQFFLRLRAFKCNIILIFLFTFNVEFHTYCIISIYIYTLYILQLN